jgi:hypothetical protein
MVFSEFLVSRPQEHVLRSMSSVCPRLQDDEVSRVGHVFRAEDGRDCRRSLRMSEPMFGDQYAIDGEATEVYRWLKTTTGISKGGSFK